MMSVRKRGQHWHYDFQIRGLRYRGAIPEARTKKQAAAVETRLRLEIFEGKFKAHRTAPLFADFARTTYLEWAKLNKRSWRSDVSHIKALCATFDGLRLDDIAPLTVERFKRARLGAMTIRGTPRSASTVNRELETLARILSLAIDAGHIPANPCAKVRKFRADSQRTRWLSADEEKRLLDALHGRETVQGLVILALQTGLRRGELFNLTWPDVDFARQELHIRQSKTGKGRVVPLNDTAHSLLAEWPRHPTSAVVFFNPRTGAPLVDIKRAFTGACQRAGVTDFHFHDLRHTCATRLADSGADAFVIAEILGHSDLSMTKRYTHATHARKRAAVAALENFRHNSVTTEKRQVS